MQGSPKLAVLIAATMLLLPHLVRAQPSGERAERRLFDSANRERAARGLPPLHWDEHLAVASRRHALRMAQKNALSHQFPGELDLGTRARLAGARFSAIAENVAEGPAASALHAEWMQSPPHRANLLDRELNSLGVAVVERNGELFAVEDFSQALADLSLKEQENQLRSELLSRGIRLLPDRALARQACAGRFSREVGYRRVFLLRYSTSDLGDLPGLLEQKIHSGLFHAAAVGACTTVRSEAFSEYSVAVLLVQ
jgi:Cysteine-rich secretory protein family